MTKWRVKRKQRKIVHDKQPVVEKEYELLKDDDVACLKYTHPDICILPNSWYFIM